MTTVLLLPGMDGTGLLLEAFAAALPKDTEYAIQIVRYPVDLPLGCARLCALVEAVVPPDGPLVFLGESFAGPLAIMLATRYRDRLRALILCGSFASNPHPKLHWLRFWLGFLPLPRFVLALSTLILLGKYATPTRKHSLRQSLARVTTDTLRARLLAVLDIDVGEQLLHIKAPILYLGASDDWVVPKAVGRRLAESIPKMKIIEIVGPHCLLQVDPLASARACVEFLQAITPLADSGGALGDELR